MFNFQYVMRLQVNCRPWLYYYAFDTFKTGNALSNCFTARDGNCQ